MNKISEDTRHKGIQSFSSWPNWKRPLENLQINEFRYKQGIRWLISVDLWRNKLQKLNQKRKI